MARTGTKKVNEITISENIRTIYEAKPMEEMIDSVRKHGILQPLLVTDSGRLLAGHRRLRAAIAVGLESVPVIITDTVLSESEIKVIMLTENLQRADLTDPDIYVACRSLMELNPTWKRSELAAHLCKDASMATRILSIDDLISEAKEAFMAGKFGFTTAYAIARQPAENQASLLAMRLSGSTRDAIEAHGTKARRPVKTTVKIVKIKCLLPSGFTVIVTGPGASLDDAADATLDARKEFQRAIGMGYSVPTFAKCQLDKARKA